MKKYSDGWTVVIFILALVFLVIDCANLGSTLLAWVFYRWATVTARKMGGAAHSPNSTFC